MMTEKPLELYVHIPFCVRKCSYCDFLSAPASAEVQNTYLKKLMEEIVFSSVQVSDHTVISVFFGGGTPSLIDAEWIFEILGLIRKYYHLASNAEITVECNPGTTLRHKFIRYREAGVNRLSIGLQSADNRELKLLGRIHSFEEFLKSYQSARMEGFSNINVDLINCFPTQTAGSWRKTLKNVLMLKPEHISVYNLIVEEHTPIAESLEAGELIMPSEEEMEQIDAVTAELMENQKYRRYEVSNYAREGFECRHNCGYWTGVPYLGFGLGASGCFEKHRYRNTERLEEYLQQDFSLLKSDGFYSFRSELELLTREEEMREFMILGLRLTQGVSKLEFYTRFGRKLEDVYGGILVKYEAMRLLEPMGGRIRFTSRGMDVSNRILAEF